MVKKYDYSDEDMRMGESAVQSSQYGRIIAVIGGRNYSYGDYNHANRKQQPGSLRKTIFGLWTVEKLLIILSNT